MHVAHHFENKQMISEALVNYESVKEHAIKHVMEKDRFDMEYLTQACSDVFFCKAYMQDDEDNLALYDFENALIAQLSFSLNIGKAMSYTFRKNDHSITPEAQDYHASAHLWNPAFFAAILLNDENGLRKLMAMDLNQFRTKDKEIDYALTMSIALKAFYLKESNYPDLLSSALEENMKVAKDNILYGKAMDIDGPALELLYLLLMERNDQFNEKLLMALEWHKKYCVRLEKKKVQDNTGLISLPICAMVRLAMKLKQFYIAHSSDYLPPYLIK